MKNKGFTLFELLGVIVIIATLSLIVFPLVSTYINKSKERLYEIQVKAIEKSAEKWTLDNLDKIDKYHLNDTYVTLSYIKYLGYLEKDNIINPKNKEIMDGCVLIKYDSNKKSYVYTYNEIDCANNSAINNSNIVYSYNNIDSELGIYKNDYVAKVPFYLSLLSKNENSLKVLGQTDSGLYDLTNEYVFRGSVVNNYVTYNSKNWRILSIDKNDYSMKLISTSGVSAAWHGSNITNFEDSSLKTILEGSVSVYSNLLDTWYNGTIAYSNPMSIEALRSSLVSTSIVSKAGLISVYDYALASTSCNANILDASCISNNYLHTMFNLKGVWTMNNDGSKIWYINNTGNLALTNAMEGTYYYYTVIKLPVNIYCENLEATGSELAPYLLK